MDGRIEEEVKMRVISGHVVEACAQAAHEANRAYCIALGDNTQVSWDEAADWQKTSARKGVLAAIRGSTPEQSHECWLEEKRDTGWTYGPVKDPEKKEHPCMVPYSDLSAEHRAKDAVFTTVVRQVAEALGEKVTYPRVKPGPSEHILQFFSYEHLTRPDLRETSATFASLAVLIANKVPCNPERTAGLRKLLEAKDCIVRAVLAKD